MTTQTNTAPDLDTFDSLTIPPVIAAKPKTVKGPMTFRDTAVAREPLGNIANVCIVASEFGAPTPEGRFDARCQCEFCKEEQHAGEHLEWKNGHDPELATATYYESVLCDGRIRLCRHHIAEIATERNVSEFDVMYGAEVVS